MSKHVITIPLPVESNLPPMDSEDSPHLHYTDASGGTAGGLQGCIGLVPQGGVPTALVVIDCDDATIGWIKAQPQYLYVEPVVEEEAPHA